MKKFIVLAGLAGVSLALTGCLDLGGGGNSGGSQGPLLRYHYVGRTALGKDGTAKVLKETEALKETAALRSHIAQKLAASATTLWKESLPADAAPQPELLRPLIEDLTIAETLIEIQGPVGKTDTLIAVELSDERARLWDTNLVQLTRAWSLGAPVATTLDGVGGWAARRNPGQGPTVQLYRVGRWSLLGIGSDKPPALSTALQAAVKSGRPVPAASTPSDILEITADLPRLKPWAPILARFPLPPVHLKMFGKGDNVRTEARLMYASRIPWKFEPWQIPTNLISEPLTSFTAVQGIKPLLERLEGWSASGFSIPNQLYTWGVHHHFTHTYLAAPQPGVSNTLVGLLPKAQSLIKPYFDTPIGTFTYGTNRGELLWTGGLPGVIPTLAPVRSDGVEFLQFKLLPVNLRRIPPPPDLFAQLGVRKDLLYYDWELSSNRVVMSRQLYQLASTFNKRPFLGEERISQKWLAAIAGKLGNAITEIALAGPQELRLVRNSQIGLTGFELATLSVWIESPGFPQRIEYLKPLKFSRPNPPAKAPAGPPAK